MCQLSLKAIENRHEFEIYIACYNTNPNGDPDMGNLPRTIADTNIGIITPAAFKRRVRDYIHMFYNHEPGMGIIIQPGTNLNRFAAEVKELAGVKLQDKTVLAVNKARLKACELYWDARTFGAVLAAGPNSGQIRGPVQIEMIQSVDPVEPTDIGITRVCKSDGDDKFKTAEQYRQHEAATDVSKLRTMGRKQFIPFGIYCVKGSISARLAAETGFDEKDLTYLFEAIVNMFDATRSDSKTGIYPVSPLIIFKHVGDPSKPTDEQRNSAILGRAPAHKLYETVTCVKKAGIETPTNHHEYDCCIDLSHMPNGIEVGFLQPYSDSGVVWGHLPADCDWLTTK